MVVKAFAPSVYQRIETGIEEISAEAVKPRQDGLLNFIIGSEMPTSQVLEPKLPHGKHCHLWWTCLGALIFASLANLFCLYKILCTKTIPVFVTSHSLRTLPPAVDDLQLGTFSLGTKPYHTSYFNGRLRFRQCLHLLTLRRATAQLTPSTGIV